MALAINALKLTGGPRRPGRSLAMRRVAACAASPMPFTSCRAARLQLNAVRWAALAGAGRTSCAS